MRVGAIVFLSLALCLTAKAQDSLNVTRVGWIDSDLWNEALSVAIEGDYAFVATTFSGLRIVDISDPANPLEVGSHDTQDYAWDVTVNGDYAYVTDGEDGLRIIDISNPAEPTEMGFYDTAGNARGVTISDSYAYVADWGALRVIDIINPVAPMEVGYCFPLNPGPAMKVAVSGNYAYIAYYEGGVRVIDVSNPAAPVEVGVPGYDAHVVDVAVNGDYIYLADEWMGLEILSIADPATPAGVGGIYWPDLHLTNSVEVSGSHALVARTCGLRVIDVSNPESPVQTGFYNTSGWNMGVAAAGGYAYMTEYSYQPVYSGLGIYDCSAAMSVGRSPTLPARIALYPAYPNPFNASTEIRFEVPRSEFVELRVYDVTGRLVEDLASRLFSAGAHSVTYDATNRGSGMYVVRMTSGEYSSAQKMVLLK